MYLYQYLNLLLHKQTGGIHKSNPQFVTGAKLGLVNDTQILHLSAKKLSMH